ncbi:MAG: chemotaxis protein CheW [candidate division Zixibacteria bacterium]|jgi:purine-binding chemotaxis protein CheW|nr:chemotaxis protein CheW [candidate division Zixibacteria bacterium]
MPQNRNHQFLCINLDRYQFGIEVGKVNEIICPKGSTEPGRGALSSENRLCNEAADFKIVRLDELLLQRREISAPEERLVVVEYEGDKIGLVVDAAREILRVSDEQITPVGHDSRDLNADFLEAEIVEDEKVIYIISMERLLQEIKVG